MGIKKVQEEIAIQDEDIPSEERLGKIHRPKERNHVPEPVQPSQVDHHEENGHDDGGSGKKFSQNDDLLDRFKLVDVCRNNQENGRCGQAYKIGKVRNIESPGDLVSHASGNETGDMLLPIKFEPDQNDSDQR